MGGTSASIGRARREEIGSLGRLAKRALSAHGSHQMNSKLISERINTQPTPFVLRLSDGTRVPVVHPDFVAVSPGQVVVIGEDEAVTRIDPLHVVAIEELPPSKPSTRRRSKK
jgi:hypothetical protein